MHLNKYCTPLVHCNILQIVTLVSLVNLSSFPPLWSQWLVDGTTIIYFFLSAFRWLAGWNELGLLLNWRFRKKLVGVIVSFFSGEMKNNYMFSNSWNKRNHYPKHAGHVPKQLLSVWLEEHCCGFSINTGAVNWLANARCVPICVQSEKGQKHCRSHSSRLERKPWRSLAKCDLWEILEKTYWTE